MEEDRGRVRHVIGGLLLAAAMMAMAGATIYFALEDHTNRDSAKAWHARSIELRHVVDARDTQLAQRTRALTVASGQLASLGGQVGTLDQRTRELAAEKAQVEDQRALLQSRSDALTKVAQGEVTCSNDLSQAIPHISAQDSAWLTVNAPIINNACRQAQNDLNAFNANYP
jgi:hypothetical protein